MTPFISSKQFLASNPECAKNIQAPGDKLGSGSYLNTPWTITDTCPALYNKRQKLSRIQPNCC